MPDTQVSSEIEGAAAILNVIATSAACFFKATKHAFAFKSVVAVP